MEKLKPIIITIIVCLVLMVAGFVSQNIRHRRELKLKTESAYIKGRSEKAVQDAELLINNIETSLNQFKQRIDEYNRQLGKIKEVSENVSGKLESLNVAVNQLDNAFTKLHRLWANSE